MKAGAQAIKCVVIGYSETSKGWRLLDIEKDRIIESRDVTFSENQFIETADTHSLTSTASHVQFDISPTVVNVYDEPVGVPMPNDSNNAPALASVPASAPAPAPEGEIEVEKILDQDVELNTDIPIYQAKYKDGSVSWEPRSSFVGVDENGEEVINAIYQQWVNTHPLPTIIYTPSNTTKRRRSIQSNSQHSTSSSQSSQRRSTRQSTTLLTVARAFVATDTPVTINAAPSSYRDAMNSDQQSEWEAACDAEMQSLYKNRTWSLVPRVGTD
jgi:hypothetical protein